MATTRQRRAIGLAMIALGLLQAVLGGLDTDPLFALLGVIYAALGAAYLWFEGTGTE